MYDRDSIWHSYDGRRTKIRDLEDTHLANIILHITKMPKPGDDMLMPVLKEEAKIRGLTDAFLERAQIPHRRKNKWYLWDYDKNVPVKVG